MSRAGAAAPRALLGLADTPVDEAGGSLGGDRRLIARGVE